MKILITGATGFIGNELVKNMEFDTRCVVRKHKKHTFEDVFEIDDLNGNTSWQGAFEGIEVVVHLAGLAHGSGYDATAYDEVNHKGTLKLAAEAANAGVKRFIFISSIGVNGAYTYEGAITENSHVNPENSYALSKYHAELALKKIMELTEMEVVIIRPPLVYGEKAPGNFSALMKLVNKLPVLPFGLVKNQRSFISVYNLIDFILICTSHAKAPGEMFLISDNELVSTKVFTNLIAKALGKKTLQLPIPIFCFKALGLAFAKKRLIEQLFGDFAIDCSKAINLLDWQPKLTMEQGLLKFTKKDERADV
jgi:nucleoside-diphosphate-sugar epimerase